MSIECGFYNAPLTRREIFAEAFGVQKDLVLEVFSKKKAAYDELQNPGNAQALLERLTCSSLNADVQAAHDAAIEDYKKRREELKPLEDLLLTHFGTKAAVADALNIHKTKLSSIMQDPPQFLQYWINDVDEMVALCRAKLDEIAPPKKRSSARSPQKNAPYVVEPAQSKSESRIAQAGDRITRTAAEQEPGIDPKVAHALLNELLKALRGNIQALKVLTDAKALKFRSQDRLELARCLVGLLELKAIDKAILSEALHGQPVESLEALSDIFALLTPFRKDGQ
ncbi:MAG: hypothetical protein P1P90_06740 [Patescibacteria group bacterium]|nr:hypothetical protein [Patescibacteria group bacterium]